jgi:hypothetical protein
MLNQEGRRRRGPSGLVRWRTVSVLLGTLAALSSACRGPGVPDRGQISVASSVRPDLAATPFANASPHAVLPSADSAPLHTLRGTVVVDGSYLLRAADAVISNNGGGIISDHGGGVVTLDDGSLVPVVAGLIGNNGGGIVIGGRTRHALLALATPATGDLVPVGGMAVVPVSLLTGKAVGPAVLSKPDGSFQVTVPFTEMHGVRLLAKVPSQRADDRVQGDPRLRYSLLVQPTSVAPHPIDEDTAGLARYLQRVAVSKLLYMLTAGQLDKPATSSADPAFGGAVQAVLETLASEWRDALARAHTAPERLPEVARRMTEVVAAYVDFETVPIDRLQTVWKDAYGQDLAAVALAKIARQLREAATLKMRADLHYFDQKPYLLAANRERAAAGMPPLSIEKPADFFDFVVEAYLVGDGLRYDGIDAVLADLGLDERDEAGLVLKTKLRSASESIVFAFSLTMVNNEACRQSVRELLDASAAPPAVTGARR